MELSTKKLKKPREHKPNKKSRTGEREREKQRKREEAEARSLVCDKLSAGERLDALDRKFGEGRGARKERRRLNDFASFERSI